MLSVGKASKQTQTKKICQLKSHQLIHLSRWNLFLNGRLSQHDMDMDKLFFIK